MRFFIISAGVSATIVGNGKDCYVNCEQGAKVCLEGDFGNLYISGSSNIQMGGGRIGTLSLGGTPPGYSQGQAVSAEKLTHSQKVYL